MESVSDEQGFLEQATNLVNEVRAVYGCSVLIISVSAGDLCRFDIRHAAMLGTICALQHVECQNDKDRLQRH